jgi:hypothetical protein
MPNDVDTSVAWFQGRPCRADNLQGVREIGGCRCSGMLKRAGANRPFSGQTTSEDPPVAEVFLIIGLILVRGKSARFPVSRFIAAIEQRCNNLRSAG